MIDRVIGTVVFMILKEGLTEDNIEKAVRFITASGRKLGSKVSAYLEARKADTGGSKECGESDGVPADVQKEVEGSLREILKGASEPVYMGGIAFLGEKKMDADVQGMLEEILTNIDEDTHSRVWEDEQDVACQRMVDDFLWSNYGCSPNKEEKDYCIGEDYLYLNLSFDDERDYFRLYDGPAIRHLADALNHLLGDRYLERFTVY